MAGGSPLHRESGAMRRGSTLAVVLALYLALGSLLTAAAGVALTSLSAASREYRRSQALALAEADFEKYRHVQDAKPSPLEEHFIEAIEQLKQLQEGKRPKKKT